MMPHLPPNPVNLGHPRQSRPPPPEVVQIFHSSRRDPSLLPFSSEIRPVPKLPSGVSFYPHDLSPRSATLGSFTPSITLVPFWRELRRTARISTPSLTKTRTWSDIEGLERTVGTVSPRQEGNVFTPTNPDLSHSWNEFQHV